MDDGEESQLFRDEAFLARHTLTPTLALEYFYSSQFYDTNCLNQKRRRGQPCGPKEAGVEYVLRDVPMHPLAESQPNMFGIFIIQKIRRDVHETETPLECYYVIGGSILRAPLLSSLLTQRLHSAFKHVSTFVDIVEHMSGWSVLEGFSWSTPTDTNNKRPPTTELNEIYSKRRCTQVDLVLRRSFEEIAASCLGFNSRLTAVREKWQNNDEEWQQCQWSAVQQRVEAEFAAALSKPDIPDLTDERKLDREVGSTSSVNSASQGENASLSVNSTGPDVNSTDALQQSPTIPMG